jgi:nicotinamidase-related amidase
MSALKFGPIPASAVHLCVDMQQLFKEDTPWRTPWMERVLPVVREIAGRKPASTIFTRFIPAERPGEGRGVWRRYWRRWSMMTLSNLRPDLVALIPDLAAFCPPAIIFDKPTYSPWLDGSLAGLLQQRRCDTLVITGGETDVCVLATVLGAVDLGYRVIVVTDALCSSSDEAHDAVLTVYGSRYGQQIETLTAEDLLAVWQG